MRTVLSLALATGLAGGAALAQPAGEGVHVPAAKLAAMVARTTDGGLTWPTPAVNLDPTLGGSDKEWTAIDLNQEPQRESVEPLQT